MAKELTLRSFVQDQLQQRQMSARKFAEFVGTSPTTINKVLSFDDTTEHTIEFLAKLATATNTDLCTLVLLVAPSAPRQGEYSLFVRHIANRISKLDDRWQEFFDAVLVAIAGQGSKE